jgi:VIT1/CCC1 family predicted Fe2+/Mn2+ transporter
MNPIKLFRKNPEYLRAAVFGANDGLVTTFAVVAGAAGAGLSPAVVVILGCSNVLADGISMALGDLLGERSERKLDLQEALEFPVWHTGVITFFFFFLAGLLPLVPYFLSLACAECSALSQTQYFWTSLVTTLVAMFTIGSARSFVTRDSWLRNGLEMLSVGSFAAAVAYFAGSWIESLLAL